jgi:RNA polymerase sigma-70 factor, ECF subfamily
MELALNNLAEKHRPMLLCYVRTLLGGDVNLAEDVVQECFLTAQRRIGEFRPEGDFGSWLRGIARNKALEMKRATARQPLLVDSRVIDGMDEVFALFDAVEAPVPDDEPWQARLLRRVQDCLRQLAPAIQATIHAVYANGLSLRDAAQTLSASPAAIGQRLCRGRELIRQCVETRRREDS